MAANPKEFESNPQPDVPAVDPIEAVKLRISSETYMLTDFVEWSCYTL